MSVSKWPNCSRTELLPRVWLEVKLVQLCSFCQRKQTLPRSNGKVQKHYTLPPATRTSRGARHLTYAGVSRNHDTAILNKLCSLTPIREEEVSSINAYLYEHTMNS